MPGQSKPETNDEDDLAYRQWLEKEKRWAVPFECSVKPVLVGWCPGCNTCEPEYRKGSTCWGDCETKHFKPRRLLKRRCWPCPGCEGYYYTKEDFRYHEHTFF